MKKFTITLILGISILSLVGCAAIKHAKENLVACWGDPVCMENAAVKSEATSNKVAMLASISPVPGTAPIVKSVTKAGMMLFLMLTGGAAILLEKKKAEPSV